jgi:hypothetical protein
MFVLNTHLWFTFLSSETGIVVIGSVEEGSEVLQIVQVFLSYFSESKTGSGLLMDECTESSLSFNEAEWDTHLSAQSWQEDHQFNWDDIVSHDDELGLLVLNQSGYVAETEFDNHWLVSLLLFLLVSLVLGFFLESLSLILLGLWRVFGQEFEQLVGLVLLEGLGELVDWGWDAQSLHKNLLLSKSLMLVPYNLLGNFMYPKSFSIDFILDVKRLLRIIHT